MPTHSFDGFLRTLQSAIGHAQGTATTRHQAKVERIVEVGPDGELRARSWSVHIQGGPRSTQEGGTVVLPLLSLRQLVIPQVTQFTLETGVEVEMERTSDPSGQPKVTLVIPTSTLLSRHELRRLRVTLTGPQPGAGEVLIDGARLKRLERVAAPGATETAGLTLARPRLHRLIGFIRRLLPFGRDAIRLGLSEEDSKRMGDILRST